MTDVTPLKQPDNRTRIRTFIGRSVIAIRWHQGDVVIDFDGPGEKSLIIRTDVTFDENGRKLDYEGTA